MGVGRSAGIVETAFAVLVAAASSAYTSPAAAQQSSLDALRAASRARPTDGQAALDYGRALRRAGHLSAAATELHRAVPFLHGPALVQTDYEIARLAIDHREHGRAMFDCKAIEKVPGGAAASHSCLAEAHLLWKRASEALVETGEALANGNQNYEAEVAEGLAYELELKEDVAEDRFRTAIGWQPNRWEAHVWLGRLLVRRLRHDEGVAELRKALALDPNGPEVNFELARTMPANAEADALLHKAVQEREGYAPALRRLAEVDVELGRLPQALGAAEMAVKADPGDASSHLVMGKVALAEGDLEQAIKEGEAALGIIANSAPAKLIIADAYAKKGEVDLAVENYEAAYGFDHSDPASLVHAAEACHAAGRDTSAKAFGVKATQEFPDWAPGWVVFGDALAADKEVPQARTAYEKALQSRGPVDAGAVKAKLAGLK